MRILILNWRDIRNPASGGAELLTHEIAKRWVLEGHKVLHFSAGFENSKDQEVIDGVVYMRHGAWWSVHVYAFLYYMLFLRNKTDVIIDEVHWFPFFSGVYDRKKTVVLVCEVANRLFFSIFPYPVAYAGRCLEKLYLKLYRNIPALAISPSTLDDIIREGHNKDLAALIPMGLSLPEGVKVLAKEKKPTLIYLARLNKQKGIMDGVDAFRVVKNEIPDAKFWIVGGGDSMFVSEVRKKIDSLGLGKSIKMFGFVSQEEKYRLLSKAHILIIPSEHEGWGLTVHEAGVVGTPAVSYNVMGLKDTIEDGKTGILVLKNPGDLALGIITLLKNRKKYRAIRLNAMKKSKQYTWENTAETAIYYIRKWIQT